MIEYLLDTHALVWLLVADPRLPRSVRTLVEDATAQGRRVACSAITLVEIVYLVEKGKLRAEIWDRTIRMLQNPTAPLVEIPVTSGIIQHMVAIPREQVADMPDRIIAATALFLRVPLISRDRKIVVDGIPTLWG
jgi:PIN domain nuclease of toxin-antitoxin system